MEGVLALARSVRTTVGGERVWKALRPAYWTFVSGVTGRRGVRLTLSDGHAYRLEPRFFAWHVDQYEPGVVRALMKTLTPASVLYDIGAHVGFITLMAGRRLEPGRGRVVAVEPAPANFAMLTRHVEINAMADRVSMVQSLVGETPATDVPFVSLPEQFTANSLAYEIDGGQMTATPMTTIDQLVADGHPVPTHIKIDVEGYEGAVLRGARATLERHRPLVVCAVHPDSLHALGETSRALVELMQQRGYTAATLDGTPCAAPRFEEIVFTPERVPA